ncbi:hypothetical protein COLO4_16219 [Corchorus olitorius]|uniref:Uncharacterized protein n=1 Tax=Corchorus olitorius TaxID=93759 RepID=A0A1R3JIK3_9ROSI|nr:hypothetical protein COLO4_16219 [Corchorus olitorius]
MVKTWIANHNWTYSVRRVPAEDVKRQEKKIRLITDSKRRDSSATVLYITTMNTKSADEQTFAAAEAQC